jgi:hypothetical protein
MHTQRYQSGADLLLAVGPVLARHEPDHSLLLGFAQSPRPFTHPELALGAFSGDTPQAAILQSSINEAIISRANAPAARSLGRALAECATRSRGLVGPRHAADAAAGAFAERAGVAIRFERRLTLHRLASNPSFTPSGETLRPATDDDEDLLVRWANSFDDDTRSPQHVRNARQKVRAATAAGRLFVLEHNGGPVAAASWSRPTANTKTINCVYTPPAQRAKGRGRAVTALLSAHLLALATRDILIFTDADDPTPNRVYARVGFRPIAEFMHWAFEWRS